MCHIPLLASRLSPIAIHTHMLSHSCIHPYAHPSNQIKSYDKQNLLRHAITKRKSYATPLRQTTYSAEPLRKTKIRRAVAKHKSYDPPTKPTGPSTNLLDAISSRYICHIPRLSSAFFPIAIHTHALAFMYPSVHPSKQI